MCGIAGFIGRESARQSDQDRVGAMLRTLHHRGPDGVGCEVRGRAVLGHARLAIIDLQTGDQPQSDAGGRYHVVCNGEIYNYKELRRDLEGRGHVFRTQSDVEVIPHLYEEMGDACVEKLRGMFAFALHDLTRDRTLLARDRLGKKPLYWARTPDGVAYASEVRALSALEGVDLSIDPEAVDLYLTLQYIPAPWSIYRGVRKLPAATTMAIAADGSITERRYWDPLPSPDATMDMPRAVEALDETLREASRLRLRSDVPVSTFLSGGIDSGLVVSYLAEQSDQLSAVTVGFGDAPEDERPLTRLTARSVGVDLHEEVVELDVATTVGEVLQHLDEPHGDSSCVPTWVVSKVAAERAKVVISGDGGDEAFAGYATRYAHNLTTHRMRSWLPRAVRRTGVAALAGVWPHRPWMPRPLRVKQVLANLSRDFEAAYARDMSILRPELKARLYGPMMRDALGDFDASRVFTEAFDRVKDADPLARMLYVDRHTYLSEGVIAKVDRMSMAHSLEVRSPLLDQEIVELAARVPSALKLSGGTGKQCLRRLADRRLPREVVTGKKSGFAPPLGAWIAGPLHDAVRASFESDAFSDIVDFTAAKRMLEEHRAGRRDWARPLWLLFVLTSFRRATSPSGSTAG